MLIQSALGRALFLSAVVMIAGVAPRSSAAQVSVSPKNQPSLAVNGSQALTFQVIDARVDEAVLIPVCTAWATNCTVYSVDPDPQDPLMFSVNVLFTTPTTVGTATTPPATVGLIVHVVRNGQLVSADTAIRPLILAYAPPVFTPKTRAEADPANGFRTFAATVRNSGNAPAVFSVSASCVVLTNCGIQVQNSFLNLNPGASGVAQAQFYAPPAGQTGTLQLVASWYAHGGAVQSDTATLTVTGADAFSPTFVSFVAPTENATVTSSGLSISLTGCDPDGALATPSGTLNGVAMSGSFTSVSSGGCYSAKAGTLTGTARPGVNTVDVSLSDGAHTTMRTVHFTYDDATEAQPVVSSVVSSELLRGGQQWSDTFSVRNPGSFAAQYALSASCPSGAASCVVAQPALTVAAGQTTKAWVAYTAPTTGTQGTVTLTASYAGAVRTVTGSKSIAVQLDQAAPTVVLTGVAANATISVLPSISIAWCDADGSLVSHTVTLDGTPLADTYVTGTRAGCAAAATSNWSNLPVTLGAHTIVATAADGVGHVTTSTTPFTFALPAVTDFQPRVTPSAPSPYLIPGEQTWAFAVRNAGTRSAPYQITPVCAAVVTSGTCRVDKSALTLATGQTDTVRLTFSVLTLPASAATFKLIASYQDLANRVVADTGVVVAQIPTFAQLYQPQLTADPATHVQSPSMITTYPVQVRNLGIAPVTYHMFYAFTGGFSTNSSLMSDSLRVGAGQTATYLVQPIAPPTSGTPGTATITASYSIAAGSVFATATLNLITGTTATWASVAVSPHAIRRPIAANTLALDTFTVTNTGSSAANFSYALTCTGAAGSCAPAAGGSTPVLQPQQSVAVPISYVGGSAPGSLGTIRLHAVSPGNSSVFDDGVITDSIIAATPVVVVTRGLSGGPTLAREQCLTIAVGDAAAYECGDLRVAHALPPTTTLNTTRAPTLVYNSRHQSGVIVVPAEVRLTGAPTGATITATVTIKNQLPDSVRFNWTAAQSNGLPRRIAVPVNARAKGLATGAYEYTFQVRATISGTTYSSIVTDTLTVINRAATQFGPGWWLDGLEQLVVVDATHKLWVGGDGSTRLYTRQSDTTWLVTPRLDRADSLTANASQTAWVRRLRNGAIVEFNAAGQHVATTNSRGHRTRFVYNATNAVLLDSIVLPVPVGAPARGYAFTHDGATGYVTRVDAPSTPNRLRRTTIQYGQPHGSWVITGIFDPDNTGVWFYYDLNDRIMRRMNRRLIPTTYAYDEGHGLKEASTAASGDAIIRTFCAAETASLTWCSAGAIRADSVRTWVDGPRSDGDTTWFKLTPYGAPSVITDALHQVTTVERGDSLWPLLPTKVTQPTGHQLKTSYDATRGLARVVTDVAPYGGADAVTTYDWDAKWDEVTLAVMPQGGGSERSFYDAMTGLKQWQEDGRGSATRVNFTYTAARLVQTVTTPGNPAGAANRIDYDALGNTWKLTSPSGIVTEAFKDAIGRDTLTKTPTDAAQTESLKLRQRFVYNAAGGDSVSVQGNAADSLSITKLYDEEGNLTEVAQRGAPDAGTVGTVRRRFTYDEADRKISESLVHGDWDVEEQVLAYAYDAAGNLITGGRDALGAVLTYDKLNRVVSRSGTNVATFTYDASGLLTADNTAAHIARSYYPNGALKTDTLHIATADWSNFGAHVYGLAYTYDLAGHKIGLDHPSQLANGTTAHTTYTYDATSGLLASVIDKFGQTYTYHYDAAGRLDQQVWRAGNSPLTETRSYDVDSRLSRRTLRMANNAVVHDDSLRYDSRDKVVKVLRLLEGGAAVDTFTFDVRGRTTKSVLGSTSETTQFDAFGNALQSDTKQGRPGVTWSAYERGSGRLQYRMGLGALAHTDTTVYDSDLLGNQYHTSTLAAHGPYTTPSGVAYSYLTLRSETQDTYDDRSKLISHTIAFDTLFQTTTMYNPLSAYLGPSQYLGTETYRYDALGRRIWARSIKGATCNSDTGSPQKWTGCHNTLTRTVWDGDQVLYEIRTDGGPSVLNDVLETEGWVGDHYGVVGYVHGYGIDEPLALDKKDGMRVIPFADWRGHFDGGLCENTVCTQAQIKFPQRNLFGAANSVANQPAPSWYGSLIEGQEDGSGYLYRRNRYFDPSTGRFTQEDPIGLAGGNNLYGFGGGDAVNYSDPFGLLPWPQLATASGFVFRGGGSLLAGLSLGGPAGWIAIAGLGVALTLDQMAGPIGQPAASVRAAPDATSVVFDRRSGRSLKREWEGLKGQAWPPGCVAHHDCPLADGGGDHAGNIIPLTPEEHVDLHKSNGDFKRWGSRGKKEPEKPVPPPGNTPTPPLP